MAIIKNNTKSEYEIQILQKDGYGNELLKLSIKHPIVECILDGILNSINKYSLPQSIEKIYDENDACYVKFKNGMTKEIFANIVKIYKKSQIQQAVDWAALGHELILADKIAKIEFNQFIKYIEKNVFDGTELISRSNMSKLYNGNYFARNMNTNWNESGYRNMMCTKTFNKKHKDNWNRMVDCVNFVKSLVNNSTDISTI